MDVLRWLYQASIPVAGYELHWLELIGVLFGLGSAIGGLRRRVWAGRSESPETSCSFCVYITVTFDHADGRAPLFGQSGRQILFILTSLLRLVARGTRFSKLNQRGVHQPVLTPRWAATRERVILACAWIVGVIVRPAGVCGDRRQLVRTTVVLLVRSLDLRGLGDRHLRDGRGWDDLRLRGLRGRGAARSAAARPLRLIPQRSWTRSTMSSSCQAW